ncbi:MAG: hypothetical protein ACK45H_05380 [Bacteroidota bacterium]
MHKLVTILVFIMLCSSGLFAQNIRPEAHEISRFRPGTMWFFTGLRPAQAEKVRKYDRLVFDLTYNDWNGDLKPLGNDWRSIGLNTNLLFDIPLNKGNTISLGTGVCHSFFRISCPGRQFTADSTQLYTQMVYHADQNPTTTKRFLGGQSFGIPVEFRFRSKGWRHIKFHVGGKLGYEFSQYAMTITKTDNGRFIAKDHGLPDPTRLIYSAHFRIGIRNWAFYGSYNLNKLFSNVASPQLNLIQVGLSISLF